MKKQIINIPIFDQTVEVIWGDTMNQIIEYINLSYNVDLDYEGIGRCLMMPTNTIIICLLNDDKNTIVHECCHAAHRLNELLGINDEEMICYFTEYLFKQLVPNV